MKKSEVGAPGMTVNDRKWRAESDLRTLREAEEIKVDHSRVNAAKSEAKKQMAALAKITHAAAPTDRASREKRLSSRKL